MNQQLPAHLKYLYDNQEFKALVGYAYDQLHSGSSGDARELFFNASMLLAEQTDDPIEKTRVLDIAVIMSSRLREVNYPHIEEEFMDIKDGVGVRTKEVSCTFPEEETPEAAYILRKAIKPEVNSLAEVLNMMGLNRIVPVEIGPCYLNAKQRLLSIKQFIQLLNSGEVAYIAQYNILEQFPELRSVLPSLRGLVNFWMGCDTVSNTHYDDYDNVYLQLVGRKYVRIYPPSVKVKVDKILHNTALKIEGEYKEAVIEAGDLLFIPRGHWHYIESLGCSVSISQWLSFI